MDNTSTTGFGDFGGYSSVVQIVMLALLMAERVLARLASSKRVFHSECCRGKEGQGGVVIDTSDPSKTEQ